MSGVRQRRLPHAISHGRARYYAARRCVSICTSVLVKQYKSTNTDAGFAGWRSVDSLPWESLMQPDKAMVPAAYSASRLWTELNLVELNAVLSSDLTENEILWNKAEIDETNPAKVLKVMEELNR